MLHARALAIVALLASGSALAQGQPGDANFCRQYAATVATAAEDAIKINPACFSPGTGVHGDRPMHVQWCQRTASDEVAGASVHIRRLASRCTSDWLVTPTEYGGYAIMGAAQFEQPYAKTRGWEVMAAFTGRLFMYCVAVNDAGSRSILLGVDQAMPGDGSQWQLAVPMRAGKDWQGRLEIDGQEPAQGAGADVSGLAVADWTIAWLNLGQVDALRQGNRAVLAVGKRDFDFDLTGAAAAISKVEECRARRGAPAETAAAPVRVAQAAPPPRQDAASNVPTESTAVRYGAAGSWVINAIKAGRRTIACEAFDTSMPNLRFEIDRENSYIDFKDGGQMGRLGAQMPIKVQFGPASDPSDFQVVFIEGRDGDKWARITEGRSDGPGLLDDAIPNSTQISFQGRNIILARPLDGSKRALDAFFRCSNDIQ
jgi:hypothetical protein